MERVRALPLCLLIASCGSRCFICINSCSCLSVGYRLRGGNWTCLSLKPQSLHPALQSSHHRSPLQCQRFRPKLSLPSLQGPLWPLPLAAQQGRGALVPGLPAVVAVSVEAAVSLVVVALLASGGSGKMKTVMMMKTARKKLMRARKKMMMPLKTGLRKNERMAVCIITTK